MTWFKVDDTLATHPKARAAGLAAMGLWVVAGAWSSQHLTDGFVPTWFVKSWPSGQKRAALLVENGLWDATENGWVFHQWDERQPSKEHVEAERAAARLRQQRHRLSRRDKSVSNGVTNGVSNGYPVPTRPVVPSGTTSVGARKRATRLPDDWAISTELRDWVVDQGITPEFAIHENTKFVDYWRGVPGLKGSKLDWPATWRNWIRRAAETNQPRPRPADPSLGRLERTLARIASRDSGSKELPR